MMNTRQSWVLGGECPNCGAFAPAFPSLYDRSRWRMYCRCGVVFVTQQTCRKPSASLTAQDRAHFHAVTKVCQGISPGAPVEVSGLYRRVHHLDRHDFVVLVKGESFPACDDCATAVRYAFAGEIPFLWEGGDPADGTTHQLHQEGS